MNLSKKSKKYIGLVVPFTCCPIGEPIRDCPFNAYWKHSSLEEPVRLVEELPEDELDKLQKFHNKCLRVKIELARKYPEEVKYSKVNLKDHFKY